MDAEQMNVRDNPVICVFSIRDLTCLLMACATTWRYYSEGGLDNNPAFQQMAKENQEGMMQLTCDLRSRITQMLFEAIGPENAEYCKAYVEMKIREMEGGTTN